MLEQVAVASTNFYKQLSHTVEMSQSDPATAAILNQVSSAGYLWHCLLFLLFIFCHLLLLFVIIISIIIFFNIVLTIILARTFEVILSIH